MRNISATGPTFVPIYSSGTGCIYGGKGCVSVSPSSSFEPRSIENSKEGHEKDKRDWEKEREKESESERERERERDATPALNLTFLRESEKLPRSRRPRSHAIAILDAERRRKRPTTTALGLSISFYLVLSPPLSYLPAYTSVTLRSAARRRDATRHDPERYYRQLSTPLLEY